MSKLEDKIAIGGCLGIVLLVLGYYFALPLVVVYVWNAFLLPQGMVEMHYWLAFCILLLLRWLVRLLRKKPTTINYSKDETIRGI